MKMGHKLLNLALPVVVAWVLLTYNNEERVDTSTCSIAGRKEAGHMNASIGTHYALAGVMLIIALLLAFLVLAINRWLGPRARPLEQNPPPEHGGRTGHKTWIQFRVRYAVLALLFVAFDMEMVFMFPWAVAFKQVGLVAFFDMFVFVAILVSAILFAWKEGAFDWER
jgi:NAD(P)H-quinone oxidoreductase subunit 3